MKTLSDDEVIIAGSFSSNGTMGKPTTAFEFDKVKLYMDKIKAELKSEFSNDEEDYFWRCLSIIDKHLGEKLK